MHVTTYRLSILCIIFKIIVLYSNVVRPVGRYSTHMRKEFTWLPLLIFYVNRKWTDLQLAFQSSTCGKWYQKIFRLMIVHYNYVSAQIEPVQDISDYTSSCYTKHILCCYIHMIYTPSVMRDLTQGLTSITNKTWLITSHWFARTK
jgi:hypothetical protein